MNCTNCKFEINEVCVNDKSDKLADFVSENHVCELWEKKSEKTDKSSKTPKTD